MDEILYLEPDEEITSVIDKLKKSESSSVGLVIPRNSALIHSIVNLKLLKKQAQKLEKEIALVTTDKVGKNIASQVGIQVYEDVHAKRPVNPLGMPELPKGDEVIEVDMSDGQTDDAPKGSIGNSSGLKIKHYSAPTATKTTVKTAEKEVKETEDSKDALTEEAEEKPESRTLPDELEDDVIVGAEPADVEASAAERVKEETMSHRRSYVGSSRPKRLNKGLLVFLFLFVFIVLATLLGMPQTSVVVTVAAEPFEKALPITVDQDAKSVDEAGQVVPGELLEVTNDDARRVVATGKKDVGGKAKGQVTITNAWDANPIRFTAGAKFTASDGKVFSLVDAVTVPGATAAIKEGQLVTNPGTVATTIQAEEPGESHNIKPSRFTIDGYAKQQDKLYAESAKEFSGGFTKQVTVLTQGDIDAAKDALAQDLQKEAIEQIKKDAKDRKLINEAINQEIVSVDTNPSKPDTETEYFDIKVKAKHQAMVFDEKQVQSVVDKALRQEVPEDKELLLGEGDEFVVSVLGNDYANGKLELESKVKTKIGTRVDAGQAKQGLSGKTESAARDQLAKLPNVKEVAIYTFPRWWWQDISFFNWNTRVKVMYE